MMFRLIVQNFWSEVEMMSGGTFQRLMGVLQLYNPDIEDYFLSYSTNLILEQTSKSPDFNKVVFDNALSECNYVVSTLSEYVSDLF